MAKKLHSNIKFDITSLDLYDLQTIDCTDETDMMLKACKFKGFRCGSVYLSGTLKYLTGNRFYYICFQPWSAYNKCLLLFPFWGETKAYICITPSEDDTSVTFGSNSWIKSIDLTNLT